MEYRFGSTHNYLASWMTILIVFTVHGLYSESFYKCILFINVTQCNNDNCDIIEFMSHKEFPCHLYVYKTLLKS